MEGDRFEREIQKAMTECQTAAMAKSTVGNLSEHALLVGRYHGLVHALEAYRKTRREDIDE
jgi:hypothetical protein